MMRSEIQVVRLPHAEGLPLPAYATPGAAGMDLLAAVTAPLVIPPGGRALVPTGLRIALPHGLRVAGPPALRPRAASTASRMPNRPGTVDEDYRGELQVIVHERRRRALHRRARHAHRPGGRRAGDARRSGRRWRSCRRAARGEGGFGSTGTR